MTACAARNGVFLMEAMWTRCFPAVDALLREIRGGAIGAVRSVQASFCFSVPDDYRGRLNDPWQAGGALLDVGVYALHFARMIYGRPPVRMASLATLDAEGAVDEQGAYIGQYDDGALSMLTASIRTDFPDTAVIGGTEGHIRIPRFWKPTTLEITNGDAVRTLSFPVPQRIEGIEDEGYQFEIRHVQDCLRAGLTESPLVPHAVTAEILRQCDELRGQWGLRYPFETDRSEP